MIGPQLPTLDAALVLEIVAKTQFSEFTQQDWYAYAGCVSAKPLIGYWEDWCVVVDDGDINITHKADAYGGHMYKLQHI